MSLLVLDRSLQELDWLPEPERKIVARLGLATWRQLLEYYPRRYEDRSLFASFPTGTSVEPVSLRGTVQRMCARYFGGRKIVEVLLGDPAQNALSGRVTCRWFNQHYVQRMLAVGQELIVYGRPKEYRNRIFIDHPEFEIIEEESEENIHIGRITPIYPLIEGVRQRALRSIMHRAVQEFRRLHPAPQKGQMSEEEALTQIHFPEDWPAREEARKVLALAEFVAMQIVVEQRKRSVAKLKGEPHVASGKLTKRFLGSLPFKPTGAQDRAIREIRAEMAQSLPMSRLLQGDVGAGKTLVAAAAMLYAVECGYQAVLMAPTQVLAEQHYNKFHEWLRPLDVRVALRTGVREEASHLELQRLGLVVIDEQHKFGVMQRSKLLERKPVPDLLVMSATPIPRTLAMTVYGDLALSVLNE